MSSWGRCFRRTSGRIHKVHDDGLRASPRDHRALRPRARRLRPRRRKRDRRRGGRADRRARRCAKPLYAALQPRRVARRAGTSSSAYQPDDDAGVNLARDFYELAERARRSTSSRRATCAGMIDEMDHQVGVIATTDPHALDGVDPARIMRRGEAMRRLLEWRNEKENAGRFTWTLGLYGTEAMAAEAGHERGGVLGADHRRLLPGRARTRSRAGARSARSSTPRARGSTRCEIERVHVEGADVDLWVTSASAAAGSAGAGATSRASRSSRAPTGAEPRAGSASTSRSTATATSSAGSASSSSGGASSRRARRRTSTSSPR